MKILIPNYTFDKTAKTVTFTSYASITLNKILLITNTTSNIIIYNFASPAKGGTVATNVLTLAYDTSAMANTDKLQIYYDDGDSLHGTTDTGVPLKTGGKVTAAIPTPVLDAQRVDDWRDEYGRTIISDKDTEFGLTTGITSLRDKLVAQRYTVLSDSIADGLASFWTTTTANGGTVTVTSGEGLLQTSAATGSAQLSSTLMRYYPGQVSWLNSAFRFGDTGTVGNTRRLGAFTVSGTTPQDGYYFELADTTLNAVVIKSGVIQSSVASTAWSKFSQFPFTLNTNYHSFEIRYTANSVNFFVDNVLRHTYSGTTSAITNTLNYAMTLQNINTSNTTNVVLGIRNIGMGRFGTPENQGILNSSPTTTTASTTCSTTGDQNVIAAVAGKQIKLLWYNVQAKASNGAATTAILKGTIATVSTQINIGDYSASQPFAHTVGAGQKSIVFDTNTPVVLNLSNGANPVYFNAEFDLI